eukprot:2088047-Rhodomonas_salina.1
MPSGRVERTDVAKALQTVWDFYQKTGARDGVKYNDVWDAVYKEVHSVVKKQGIDRLEPMTGDFEAKKSPYFDASNKGGGGWILDEGIIVLSLARYNLLDSTIARA